MNRIALALGGVIADVEAGFPPQSIGVNPRRVVVGAENREYAAVQRRANTALPATNRQRQTNERLASWRRGRVGAELEESGTAKKGNGQEEGSRAHNQENCLSG
jgi:hypothetical protein